MNSLEVRGLRKVFQEGKESVVAVEDISFSIKKGEIFGILGVNGAGKSTTINMLLGLTTPSSGTITILDKDPVKDSEFIRQRINVANAYQPLNDVLTVQQNLLIYAKLYGVKNPKQKLLDLTKLFMLSPLLNREMIKLSSGEKTRLILAKSFLNDPELIFMDECTVGLDPDMAELTRKIIKKYNGDHKCSILFTSHYMLEVEELCDRIAFMDKGRIVKVGTAKEILKDLKLQSLELHVLKDMGKLVALLKKEQYSFLEKNGFVTITLPNAEKVIHTMLQKIIESGIKFDDIHLKKPTLEDYFIQMARKK